MEYAGPMARRFWLAVLLSLAAASSGCIAYEEELWLNADGSGRMSFEVSMSEAVMALANNPGAGAAPAFSMDQLQTDLAKREGVTVEESQTFSRSGKRVLAVKLRFSSLDFTKEAPAAGLSGSPGSPNLFGAIQIGEDESGNLVLSRTIGPLQQTDAVPSDDALAKSMEEAVQAMLANYAWKYTVHFPSKVIRANTAGSYIDQASNTVTWEFSLASLMSTPGTMNATVANPVPQWLRFVAGLGPAAYAAILVPAGLLGLGAVVGVRVALRRRRTNRY